MQTETASKKCPDCGEAMEPQAMVSNNRLFSRWWRCSNGRCRAQWLLPAFSPKADLSDTWTF